MEIKLTKGKSVIIDDEDYVKIKDYNWHFVHSRKGTSFFVYRQMSRQKKNKSVGMHHQILNISSRVVVLFKDGNGLNCKKDNLIVLKENENKRTRKSSWSSSGFLGVTWNEVSGKYQARICKKINGKKKQLSIGYYEDKRYAAFAFNCAANFLNDRIYILNDVNVKSKDIEKYVINRLLNSGFK